MSVLELSNIQKTYPHPAGPVHVLKGVSAQFDRGESVAILGPSGSGKSTLLSLMAGLDRPDNGTISCIGQDLSKLSERDLTAFRAKHLSIVFQQFRLMPHMTALENVRLPLDLGGIAQPLEKANAGLERVGLGARSQHFPRQLSGGECQRVAIARALAIQPKILLADEPSGNLDTETGKKVMDLLFDIVQENKATLILVTHDTALATRCERTLTLNNGCFDAKTSA